MGFSWLKRNWIDILIFVGIFCLAFSIRTMMAPKFPNIYGFDSIKEAKMTKFLLENGFNYPFLDNTTDYCDYKNYPEFCNKTGYPPSGREYLPHFIGWWALEGGIYKIVAGMHGISEWDYDLFGKVASWLNAIVGALGPAFLFLFISRVFNKEAGLIAGLFLAFFPPHLSYSMYGHAENDALGLTLFFASLWLFTENLNKKNWKLLIPFGAVLFWNAGVWQSYSVGVSVMSLVLLLDILVTGMKTRTKELEWKLVVLTTIAITGFVWDLFFDYTSQFGDIIALGSLLIGGTYSWFVKNKNQKFLYFAGAAVLMLGILVLAHGMNTIFKPFYKVGLIDAPPRNETVYEYRKIVYETIAEQQPIPGNHILERIDHLADAYGHGFAIKLSFWTVFILTTLFAINFFIREDFFKKFQEHAWLLVLSLLVLYSIVSLSTRPISMFFLTGIEGIAVGAFFGVIINITRERIKKEWILPLILFSGIFFASTYLPMMVIQANNTGYDIPPDWFQAFEFLKTHASQGDVVTAWWDYGHWLTYFTGNKVYVNIDNIQDRADFIYQVATAFTQTPCRVQGLSYTCDLTQLEQAEVNALKLLRPLGTTYILIDKEIVLGKYGAIEHISGNYIGCFQAVKLRETGNGTYDTGLVSRNGQRITITEDEWTDILNSTAPNGYLLKGQLRVFGKEDSSGKYLYIPSWYQQDEFGRISCGRFAGDSPVIYSFSNRIFFHDKNLKYVEPVFDNGWIVIYKVNWDKFCEKYDCKAITY